MAFVVGLRARFRGSRPIAPADVTELVTELMDEFDRLGLEGSVSMSGTGSHTDAIIEVVVDSDDELEAWSTGTSAIHAALHAAEVVTAGLMAPTELQPSLRRELLEA